MTGTYGWEFEIKSKDQAKEFFGPKPTIEDQIDEKVKALDDLKRQERLIRDELNELDQKKEQARKCQDEHKTNI